MFSTVSHNLCIFIANADFLQFFWLIQLFFLWGCGGAGACLGERGMVPSQHACIHCQGFRHAALPSQRAGVLCQAGRQRARACRVSTANIFAAMSPNCPGYRCQCVRCQAPDPRCPLPGRPLPCSQCQGFHGQACIARAVRAFLPSPPHSAPTLTRMFPPWDARVRCPPASPLH